MSPEKTCIWLRKGKLKERKWIFSYNSCDTMWVVRQADDPCVCFGAKPNKGLSSRSLTRPKVGEKKPVGKGTQSGSVGKGSQRGGWWRETQGGSRERTAVGTSQDELEFQSGQRSAEGGSEENCQRWVGILCGFCRSFAKNTLSAIKKCHKTTLLAFGADLSPYCSFVLFLPLPRLYFLWLYCVIARSEPTGWITGHE